MGPLARMIIWGCALALIGLGEVGGSPAAFLVGSGVVVGMAMVEIAQRLGRDHPSIVINAWWAPFVGIAIGLLMKNGPTLICLIRCLGRCAAECSFDLLAAGSRHVGSAWQTRRSRRADCYPRRGHWRILGTPYLSPSDARCGLRLYQPQIAGVLLRSGDGPRFKRTRPGDPLPSDLPRDPVPVPSPALRRVREPSPVLCPRTDACIARSSE